MSLGQIIDVNVVSYTGTVRSWIIGSKNPQWCRRVAGRGQRERYQMCLRIVDLDNLPTLIRSGGVEVPQGGIAQTVCAIVSLKRMFKEQLADPVRIDRLPRRILLNWNGCWRTVNGAGRGENKSLDATVNAGIQERQRILDVVAEILARIHSRLAHIGVSGEMDDRLDAPQFAPNLLPVADLTHDQLEAFCKEFMPRRKIVVDDDLVA